MLVGLGPDAASICAKAMRAERPERSMHLQVFDAPHIQRLSSLLGATFSPIVYRLQDEALVSNVKYSHPVLGQGWLSAGGTLSKRYDDTVEVKFDRFWIDGPETLLPDILVSDSSPLSLDMDAWMSRIG